MKLLKYIKNMGIGKFFKKKLVLILIISFVFILILVLFFASLFNSWWRLWPQNIKSNIALNRLAISVYKNPICRNECFYEQLEFQQVISSDINNQKLNKKLRQVIFNPNDNLNWRMMALNLIKQNQDESIYFNDFLKEAQDYLDTSDFKLDIKFKHYLLFNFYYQLNSDQYLRSLKDGLSNNSLNEEELIDSIKFLSGLNIFLEDLYFQLFSNSNLKVKKEILSALGGYNDRFNIDRSSLYSFLSKAFLDKGNDFEIKRLVIFILSDFVEQKNDQEVLKVLDNFYYSENTDKFSKYLLAEILNNNLFGVYEFPEISEQEWQTYYF